MKMTVKDVRVLYRMWLQRNELLDELCCSSNIGYPSATIEATAGEGGGDRPKGSKVPVKELDAIHDFERNMEQTCQVMRVIPEDWAETLRLDYLGVIEHSRGRQHREAMRMIAVFWSGVLAGIRKAA